MTLLEQQYLHHGSKVSARRMAQLLLACCADAEVTSLSAQQGIGPAREAAGAPFISDGWAQATAMPGEGVAMTVSPAHSFTCRRLAGAAK